MQEGMVVLLVILICAAHGLKHNKTLSHLELYGCGLSDEAIVELCDGLKCSNLKILDLEGNPFGVQGAKHLADVISDHSTLEKLGVRGCRQMSGCVAPHHLTKGEIMTLSDD